MSKKKYKLSEIADYLGGKIFGDSSIVVSELNTLKEAQEGSISFIYNRKFLKELDSSSASAVLISPDLKEKCEKNCIVVDDPHLSYARLTKLFAEDVREKHIDDSSKDFTTSKDIQIGKNVYIGQNVKIGKGVIIGPGCFIGNNVEIGEESYLYPNVTIYSSTILGKKNIIHANSVLGSDGLGFSKNNDFWEKIEHLGNLILADNVEIGAACTIDRGSLGNTVLNSGVKLDNQVHIAHNCNIGKNTIIGAKTAIAGSTKVGEDCLIGGGCGIVDNIEIEKNVRINPMTYVAQSIKKSGIYSGGSVVLEHSKWLKHITIQKKQFDD